MQGNIFGLMNTNFEIMRPLGYQFMWRYHVAPSCLSAMILFQGLWYYDKFEFDSKVVSRWRWARLYRKTLDKVIVLEAASFNAKIFQVFSNVIKWKQFQVGVIDCAPTYSFIAPSFSAMKRDIKHAKRMKTGKKTKERAIERDRQATIEWK